MAKVNVLLKLLNAAGALINPRREDGHGATAGNPTRILDPSEHLECKDAVTVTNAGTQIVPFAAGTKKRSVLIHVPADAAGAVHLNAGTPATRRTLPVPPNGTFKANTNQAIYGVSALPPGTTLDTTPDSSSFGHHGTLVGSVLPALVPSPFAGHGNALEFDGVDRGANTQCVDFGTSQDFALRGQTGASAISSALSRASCAGAWQMDGVSGDFVDRTTNARHMTTSGSGFTRNTATLVPARQNNPFEFATGALTSGAGGVVPKTTAIRDQLLTLSNGTKTWSQFCVVSVPALTLNETKIIFGDSDGYSFTFTGTLAGMVSVQAKRGLTFIPLANNLVPGAVITLALTYNGAALVGYLNGTPAAAAVASATALAATTFNLIHEAGAGLRAQNFACFTETLTAAVVAASHTAATIWDGKRPKTIDVRLRSSSDPPNTNNRHVMGRGYAHDWELTDLGFGFNHFALSGLSAALGLYDLRFTNNSALAGVNSVLRIVDDRTVLSLGAPGQPPSASTFERPFMTETLFPMKVNGRGGWIVDRPSWHGIIDELRVSNIVRTDGPGPYVTDANTLALLHFDSITLAGGAPAPDVVVYPVIGTSDE